MLRLAQTFLTIALTAGFLGFSGASPWGGEFFRLVFLLFLVLTAATFVVNFLQTAPPADRP